MDIGRDRRGSGAVRGSGAGQLASASRLRRGQLARATCPPPRRDLSSRESSRLFELSPRESSRFFELSVPASSRFFELQLGSRVAFPSCNSGVESIFRVATRESSRLRKSATRLRNGATRPETARVDFSQWRVVPASQRNSRSQADRSGVQLLAACLTVRAAPRHLRPCPRPGFAQRRARCWQVGGR